MKPKPLVPNEETIAAIKSEDEVVCTDVEDMFRKLGVSDEIIGATTRLIRKQEKIK